MARGADNLNNNSQIAAILYEMAEILELKQVKWKPQAYIIAAQTLESLKEDVFKVYAKGGEKALLDLPGIGEAIAGKIVEYLNCGKIKEHELLKSTLPAGLLEIMRVPGIGAKKASIFYNKLGIKNIDELARAAEEHRLQKLEGFKEKSEENITRGIEMMKLSQNRISLVKARKLALIILAEFDKLDFVEKAIAAGSLRRKKSMIRDLDIVVLTSSPIETLKKFVKMKFVKQVLSIGEEKATIMTREGMQVDVRVFNEEEFGSGLLYFTGDKQHNIWLRKLAIKKGWKLNEYGLFDGAGKRIAGKTEDEVYEKLGLAYIEPEKRTGAVK